MHSKNEEENPKIEFSLKKYIFLAMNKPRLYRT